MYPCCCKINKRFSTASLSVNKLRRQLIESFFFNIYLHFESSVLSWELLVFCAKECNKIWAVWYLLKQSSGLPNNSSRAADWHWK